MSNYTINKLANYIISEVERNLNIGECFKQNNNYIYIKKQYIY